MTKIAAIRLSIFEIADNTGLFTLHEESSGPNRRWVRRGAGVECQTPNQTHVLHVITEDGVEGVGTADQRHHPAPRTDDRF